MIENAKFEVGKTYHWFDRSYDPFTVLSRTEKTITVTNGQNTWRMLVRVRPGWGEYVCDSSMPKRYHEEFTSWAQYVCK